MKSLSQSGFNYEDARPNLPSPSSSYKFSKYDDSDQPKQPQKIRDFNWQLIEQELKEE